LNVFLSIEIGIYSLYRRLRGKNTKVTRRKFAAIISLHAEPIQPTPILQPSITQVMTRGDFWGKGNVMLRPLSVAAQGIVAG